MVTVLDEHTTDLTTLCYADSGVSKLFQYMSYDIEMKSWHLHILEIFSGICNQAKLNDMMKAEQKLDSLKLSEYESLCTKMSDCDIKVSFIF